MYGGSNSSAAVDVSFDVVDVDVSLLELVKLAELLKSVEALVLPPVITCGIIVVLPDMVALPDAVRFPVVPVSLLAVVVFSASLVVVTSPMSKIREAIEPLAENVPPVALVDVLVVVLLVEVALVLLDEFELLVAVESDGGVYCATAGARLNAAAKSPKTSTSATAIGAFFIAENVHK
jgi:hypothetical protein